MTVFSTSIALTTEEGTEVSDITKLIRDAIQPSLVTTGIALINTLHTTCALFVNEYQAALVEDLTRLVERLVPERGGYRHERSALFGLRAGQRPLPSAGRSPWP